MEDEVKDLINIDRLVKNINNIEKNKICKFDGRYYYHNHIKRIKWKRAIRYLRFRIGAK
jgi:hypothetical protein